MDTRTKLGAGTALAVALFAAVNLLGGTVFSGARLDLTEERLFTLSDGAKRIAADLDEPVRLDYYASSALRESSPLLATFMRRVEDVLEEFVRASDGKLVLERFDPVEFSEAEDEAALNGLERVRGERDGPEGFFGLVMRNTIGERQTIPFFSPADETFLEYEVAQRLLALDAADKPVVALVSGLPLFGQPAAMPGQRPQPEWRFLPELRRQFEVRDLGPDLDRVGDDVDVLLLVHPVGLPDAALYAIDQYALGGGRVLAFVDPLCAVAASLVGPDQVSSDLGGLLAAWGLDLDTTRFVADRKYSDDREGGPGLLSARYPGDAVDRDDPVTARLSDLVLYTPGALVAREDATATITPLVTTSAEAGTLSVASSMGVEPEELAQRFLPSFEVYTLAARVSGPVRSAFPDGPPGPADGPEEPDDESARSEPPAGHLSGSSADLEAIVVADADLLYDLFWVQRSMFGLVKTSENVDLLLNALEQLTGGDALLGLRARGTFERPFEKVRELRRLARERLDAEERRLEAQLDEIDANIDRIASEQGDGGTVLLTPELQQELERAYEARAETRAELRRVRYDLRREEEALGRRVEAVNIAGPPLLVAVAGVVTLLVRRRRRTGAA